MKKTLLFLFCFLSSYFLPVSAQLGQIVNGGFENWTSTVAYETPQTWHSSNQEIQYPFYGVVKSTDYQHGLLSVRLESEIIGTDTILAFVYHGHAGNGGPDGGITYTSACDRLRGYYKCDFPTNDSGLVIVVKFVSGTPVFHTMAIGGTTPTWTMFDMQITPGPQDSVFVGVISGNPFDQSNTNTASWIQVDNLYFHNTLGATPAAIPNYSFETWDQLSVEDPDNWYSLNEFLIGAGLTPCLKTTDKNSGLYAAELTNQMLNGTDTVPGFISVGAFNFSSMDPFEHIPYDAEPTTFSGFYKYTPANGDVAQIVVNFFAAGSQIGGYSEMISSTVSTYTPFNGSVNLSGTPDSIQLVVFPGNNPGSVLKVDDLSLSGGNVAVQELAAQLGLSAWPNPAEDQFTIAVQLSATSNTTVTITDVSGKVLSGNSYPNLSKGESKLNVDVSNFASGIYFYTVKTDEVSVTNKFIVK